MIVKVASLLLMLGQFALNLNLRVMVIVHVTLDARVPNFSHAYIEKLGGV